MVKKIAILTSGGDSPGMNTAVATVIRVAIQNNMKPYIIKDGYLGMYNGWIEETNLEFANKIMSYGGTSIGSARMPEFSDIEIRKVAIANLKKFEIEAVVVIGGDGSYMGALKLTQMGINCIGIPGTIDNDIASTDYTIGFDTCLNTIVNSIDNIRDTMNSHNRCGVIETMGHHCGDLALFAAQATGAEVLSMSEHKLTEMEIAKKVKELYDAKQRSVIVIVSELQYDILNLAKIIEKESKYVTKATSLAYVQRGGRPSAFDRVLAYKLSIKAISELKAGKGGKCIGIINNELKSFDITSALKMKRTSRLEDVKTLSNVQKSYLLNN